MKPVFLAIAASLTLSACGQSDQKDATTGAEVADKLDRAADQSGPAAKQVLEGAAAEARKHSSMAPVDEPGSFAQDAMQKAGEAEASTLASGKPAAAAHHRSAPAP